jgi:hypothetical protein
MFMIGLDFLVYRHFAPSVETPVPIIQVPIEPEPEPELKPINYDIVDSIPSYQEYNVMVSQLQAWNKAAPELTEIGTYGTSSRGTPLHYIRINNPRVEGSKPVVLTHAAIHGDEPWAGCTVMAYIGTILNQYGDDSQITQLVDSRDLYFIPIVSPDSHPGNRDVDGVDPNRNYPTQRFPDKQSVKPIQALRDFFLAIEPKAVISGHTWGEVYVYPWGDSNRRTPSDPDFRRILGEMSRLSGYSIKQACYVYRHPIYGTEMDWYYRNNALPIVIEYGTHQRPPSDAQIESTFNRTFGAVLYFMEEAPRVDVKLFSVWKLTA